MLHQTKINVVSLALSILIFLAFSCVKSRQQEKVHYFQYVSKESDSIVPFTCRGEIKYLKENLYIADDILYIGLPYYIDTLQGKNQVIQKRVGTILINPIDYDIVIDTASYQFLVEELISKDKNQILAYPIGLFKTPFIQVLKLNPKQTRICDHEATYLRDDSLVYCFPTNTYLDVNAKEFEVVYIRQVPFGKHHNVLYYWDEPLKTEE